MRETLHLMRRVTGVESFEDCRRILRFMKQNMNGLLASFELMDAEAVRCVEANFDVPICLPAGTPFQLLVETHGRKTGF